MASTPSHPEKKELIQAAELTELLADLVKERSSQNYSRMLQILKVLDRKAVSEDVMKTT
jgi:hypothetical protein